MKLLTRETTEDFFHDIIAKILPHMQKSDIRPAFQKTKQPNPAGRNYISNGDDSNNGLLGFTNTDNFCYFKIDFDKNSSHEAEVDVYGNVTIVRLIDLTVYLYGKASANNALLVKSLMRSTYIQDTLNSNGYYLTSEGYITPLDENINGEWWERNDVNIQFECRVEIDVDSKDLPQDVVGYNEGTAIPKLIVDGKERK